MLTITVSRHGSCSHTPEPPPHTCFGKKCVCTYVCVGGEVGRGQGNTRAEVKAFGNEFKSPLPLSLIWRLCLSPQQPGLFL